MDLPSLPSKMLYRVKKISNIIKQTVRLIPNVASTTVLSQQNAVRVDLPVGIVDLSTFQMGYYAYTTPNGAPINGATGYQQVRYLPRYSASLIETLEVLINGTSRVYIPNYNLVYNILHDFKQGEHGNSKRRIGENIDPSCKYFNQTVNIAGNPVNNYLCPKKGYPVGLTNATAANSATIIPAFPNCPANVSASLNDFDAYSVRSWLSFFGENSTKIIDTSIFGQITIIITFTKSAATMLGAANTTAIVALPNTGTAATTAQFTLTGGGNAYSITAPAINNDSAIDVIVGNALGAAIASSGNTYSLTNLHFTMVRYDMPPEFYNVQANVLASGNTYNFYFQNYNVFTGNPIASTQKTSVMRVSIASSSVDYVIGTFRAANFDDNVDATNQVILSQLSSEVMGEYGQDSCTWESQCKLGKTVLFNNSKYFVRNGESINSSKWQLGNTPLLERGPHLIYEEMLRHFNIQDDKSAGIHAGCRSLQQFNKTYFADILSLNCNNEFGSDVYNVSGKNSDELPLFISWETTSTTAFAADATWGLTAANTNCTPYMIVATSPHLEISYGRNIVFIP